MLTKTLSTLKNCWTANGKIKFLIIALGIFLSFVYVGVFQEKIMRGCYGGEGKECKGGEKYKFAITLVLVKSFCGLVFVTVLNLIWPEKNKDTTHWGWYASTAAANSLSMVTSNMSLRWVTYPMQVIFKSAKPLSVMILGLMFCKKYTIQRYFFVLIIVSGVIVFKLFEAKEEKPPKKSEHEVTDMQQIYGTGLLILSLSMDGVLGAIQDRMRAVSRPSFRQLMFQMCAWVCGILLVAVLVTQEFMDVIPFIGRHPSVLWHLGTLGFADAVGNMFIFTMISTFGALACSVTGTVRKFFSVIFSIIFFRNPSTLIQWIGAVLVFAGLLADAFFGKGKAKKAPIKPTTESADVEKAQEANAEQGVQTATKNSIQA